MNLLCKFRYNRNISYAAWIDGLYTEDIVRNTQKSEKKFQFGVVTLILIQCY